MMNRMVRHELELSPKVRFHSKLIIIYILKINKDFIFDVLFIDLGNLLFHLRYYFSCIRYARFYLSTAIPCVIIDNLAIFCCIIEKLRVMIYSVPIMLTYARTKLCIDYSIYLQCPLVFFMFITA